MLNKILKNNILLIPRESIGYSTISFFIAGGSRYENKNTKGVAHLLEHLIVSSADMGSEIYAETQLEQIVIQSTQLTEKTSEALKKMYDILFKNPPDIEHFENQKKRILIELQTHYSHEEHAWVYGRLFGKNSKHYKGWSGDKKSINEISYTDALNFKDTYIRPERTVCVIAGDFDIKAIENTLSSLELEYPLFKNDTLHTNNSDEKILLAIQQSDSFSNVELFISLSPLQDFRNRILNRLFRNYLIGTDGHLENLLFKQIATTYNIDDNSLYWTNGGVLSIAFQIDTQTLDQFTHELNKIFSSPKEYLNESIFEKAKEQTILHYRQLFNDLDKTSWWFGEDILLTGESLENEQVTSTLESLTPAEFIDYIKNMGSLITEISL